MSQTTTIRDFRAQRRLSTSELRRLRLQWRAQRRLDLALVGCANCWLTTPTIDRRIVRAGHDPHIIGTRHLAGWLGWLVDDGLVEQTHIQGEPWTSWRLTPRGQVEQINAAKRLKQGVTP